MNHQGVLCFASREGQRRNFKLPSLPNCGSAPRGGWGSVGSDIQDNVIVLSRKSWSTWQAWAKIKHAMASVQDAHQSQQSPQEQEEEIAEIIKEYRHDHAKRRLDSTVLISAFLARAGYRTSSFAMHAKGFFCCISRKRFSRGTMGTAR